MQLLVILTATHLLIAYVFVFAVVYLLAAYFFFCTFISNSFYSLFSHISFFYTFICNSFYSLFTVTTHFFYSSLFTYFNSCCRLSSNRLYLYSSLLSLNRCNCPWRKYFDYIFRTGCIFILHFCLWLFVIVPDANILTVYVCFFM